MADFKITQLKKIDYDSLPFWDVVIIGAGPAGLVAALTTAHRGLTTLVIEAEARAGGQPEFLYPHKLIVDIPGFPDGITGEEISKRVYQQALNASVQFRFFEEFSEINDTQQKAQDELLREVVTNKGTYLCRKVIIACGLLHLPRRFEILDRLDSDKVSYRIPRTKDYNGQRVIIVGGGDSALDAAVVVLKRNGLVDLIVRKAKPRGKADTISHILELGGKIHTMTEIAAAELVDNKIRATLSNDEVIESDLAIVQIGFLEMKEKFKKLDVKLNENGSIAINPFYETSRSGIFAVGDVHGEIKLIGVAWAEGIQAAIYAFKEITSPYWMNEKRTKDQHNAVMEKLLRDSSKAP